MIPGSGNVLIVAGSKYLMGTPKSSRINHYLITYREMLFSVIISLIYNGSNAANLTK
jgi:hypothetical protein